MAKIYLKFGRPPLEEVNEDVAQELRRVFMEAQKNGDDLSRIQKSVDHRDGNFLLTFSQIDSFNNDKASFREKHTFSDADGLKRFKDLYGNISASIVEGYGLLDRTTTFQIMSNQARLDDMGTYKVLRSNSNMSNESKEKLNDLWQEYNEKYREEE